MKHPLHRIVTVIGLALSLYALGGFAYWSSYWSAASNSSTLPGTPGVDSDAPGLRLRVTSVFGDPLPGATVYVSGTVYTTDARGEAEIGPLPSGVYEVQIEAAGYHPHQELLRVEDAPQHGVILIDEGMWPVGFAVDFHIFHSEPGDIVQPLYALIQFANGTESPVYIRSFRLDDGNGEPLLSLLDTPEEYESIAFANLGLTLTTDPYALILQPQRTARVEVRLASTTPKRVGRLRLSVWSGDERQHAANVYDELEANGIPTLEPDFDPHMQ